MPDGNYSSEIDGSHGVAAVVAAVFVFGISFGAVATSAGVSFVPALFMSATTFGGAAQVGSVSVLGAGGGVASAVLTGALLNVRYLPMGITVASSYRGRWWCRAAQAQLLGDETWALSRTREGNHDRRRLLTAGAAVYVVWLAGTAIGAVGLRSVGDVSSWGLDVVSPAIFLGLLAKQLTSTRARLAAGSAVVVALGLAPITPAGVPVAVASLICLIGLVR